MRGLVVLGASLFVASCLSKPPPPGTTTDGSMGDGPGPGSGSGSGCPTLRLVQVHSNGNGQSPAGGGGTQWNTSAIYGTATLAGSTIICASWHMTPSVTNDSVASYTDNKGNSYVRAGTTIRKDGNTFYDLWYTTGATAGVHGWTATLAVGEPNYYNEQECWEYAGISSVDAGATALSGSAVSDAAKLAHLGTITTAAEGLIFVAFNQSSDAIAMAGAGYTLTTASGRKFETATTDPGEHAVTAITTMANQSVTPFWAVAFRCAP
jgi:hypothetical protein